MTVHTLLAAAAVALTTPYCPTGQVYTYGAGQAFTYQTPVVGVPYNYHYSVGEPVRTQQIADLVAGRVADMLGVDAEGAGEAPPEESPPPRRFRLIGGGLDRGVLALFERSCVGCHEPGSKKGGVTLVADDGSLFADPDPRREWDRRAKIARSVAAGKMPKNGKPLGAADQKLLKDYLNAKGTR